MGHVWDETFGDDFISPLGELAHGERFGLCLAAPGFGPELLHVHQFVRCEVYEGFHPIAERWGRPTAILDLAPLVALVFEGKAVWSTDAADDQSFCRLALAPGRHLGNPGERSTCKDVLRILDVDGNITQVNQARSSFHDELHQMIVVL